MAGERHRNQNELCLNLRDCVHSVGAGFIGNGHFDTVIWNPSFLVGSSHGIHV